MTTWNPAQTPTHPAADDPRMVDHLDPQAEDHPESRREEGHQTGDPPEDHQVETRRKNRRERTSLRTSGDGSCLLEMRFHPGDDM